MPMFDHHAWAPTLGRIGAFFFVFQAWLLRDPSEVFEIRVQLIIRWCHDATMLGPKGLAAGSCSLVRIDRELTVCPSSIR